MPVTWDAEADRKLLIAIIECSNVSIDNAAVANRMKQHDMDCTPMAIQKRLQRIRTVAKDGVGTPNGTPKSKTPSKRKDRARDGDNEEPKTPLKRSKISKGKVGTASALPLDEPADDSENDNVKKEEEEVEEYYP
ncbi:hypothetical protein K431DRAFT_295877 [Polychaeton citri CBS 116435]|uniref:Uncharacterized protein n=1 Tax=Polychaeton citri CBS 116435 TaxID=1314669 RepID=A0A9P4Q748_9PEZI|nr:hypothetical protein K431DRAFT_295877 [Polychaeton citri CBS 116435]